MSFIREFRDFPLRGNVVDRAIAVVIAAAFGIIVSSFVDGILKPLLNLSDAKQKELLNYIEQHRYKLAILLRRAIADPLSTFGLDIRAHMKFFNSLI